jgi:ATP-binding cassette subfamily B protein
MTPADNASDRQAAVSPGRRFLGLLLCHKGLLGAAFVCALLMTVLGIGTSYYIQHLVDSVLVRHERRLLHALGVGMLVVVLFRTLFSVLRQYLLAHVSRQVDLRLIYAYARHLLGLPLSFFSGKRVGEITSRLQDVTRVREAISGTTLVAVVDGTLVVVLLAALWLYDLPLALVATAFVPVLMASAAVCHPASQRSSRAMMETWGALTSHLVEDICAVETIKAWGAERLRAAKGEAVLVRFVQAMFGFTRLTNNVNALGLLVTALAGIVILWYGGQRVMNGALTMGQLLFFYTLLAYLLGPLERLASVNLKVQETLTAVQRLYQFLDQPAEQLKGAGKAPFSRVKDAIELRDVCFRYRDDGPDVLEHISLRIPAGKTVAVVGESGGGKSTLVKLLMGFCRPTAGRILLDGIDLDDFELEALRGGIGLVSQEPFIFAGTIRDNIAVGRPEATLEEVMEAAAAASLAEVIAALPRRYETVVGEWGNTLSGGQKQRLAIARTLVRRPEILIFDEATSHLDTATERAIQESLASQLRGRTVVLVAHRLSTIRDADLIYVLQQGQVVEQGTHQQLLAQGGWYHALWQAQTDTGVAGPRPTFRMAAVNGRNGTSCGEWNHE